ncbi:MAG TPA: hypothetical protein PKC29_06190 [Thermodesulfobacteriota bacterium]|nr:hypothetical protein [Thermodesulfobacteriota bacterium]
MDKKTIGAWIIHHNQKLKGVALSTEDYDQITFAGKCGTLLNVLAQSEEIDIDNPRLSTLASANGISPKLELRAILSELENQRLIDQSESGISILGLTTAQTLEHIANIFEQSSPSKLEEASIVLAEKVSEIPIETGDAIEYLSDEFGVGIKRTKEIVANYEQIGFIDSEEISDKKILFNGNLFRGEDIRKVQAVLSSLSSGDVSKFEEYSEEIARHGCIAESRAQSILGKELYSKLCSIGLIDKNTIGNERGTFSFVTRPGAFCKFTNTAADDAFDLAKAFVTSLTFGIHNSPGNRGRIRMIEELIRALIDGRWIGPATAIGHDYKVLEIRGVVEVKKVEKNLFKMRLLKKDVGQLALKVITEGEASTESLLLPSISAMHYTGPESNRSVLRRSQPKPMKEAIAELVDSLRMGGIK